LPSNEIVVDALLWSLLVAVQGSSAVCEVVDRVQTDELEVCAALALLVADGLAEVSAPVGAAAQPQIPLAVPIELVETPFPQHFPIDDLVGSDDADSSHLWHRAEEFIAPPAAESLAGSMDTATAAAAWDQLVSPLQDLQELDPDSYEPLDSTDSGQEDVFRQMSTLSPQAADAIAAALNANPVLDQEGFAASSGRDTDSAESYHLESSIVEAELARPDTTDEILGLISPQGEFPAVEVLGEDEGPVGPISFIGSF
jgi:hypothetical protein